MALSRQVEFKITPATKKEIIKIIDERIREAHVTKEDFSELKAIVKDLAQAQQDLAQAQKRTEQRLEELAQAQQELAQAQKKTEQRLEELAQAQKKTEKRLEDLARAQKRTEEEVRKLAIGLRRTREDLGGLSRSFSYAFENEAYRNLPNVLKSKYNIEVKDRIVRADIGGKEINFFAKAQKDGKDIYIIGEAKIRLDKTLKRSDVLKELEEKIKAVKKEYGDVEVLKLLVTHFATKSFLKMAQSEGIIVIQSYEW